MRERLPWVSWSRAGRGLFEIDGIPAPVLRHFSQRRVEIEQRAAELVGPGGGRLSRERMQGVALATRRPKENGANGAGWREDARARSAEQGFGPDELRELCARPPTDPPRPNLRAVVSRLSGPEGLTANHNTFVRRHALAEIAGEFTAGIGLRGLERATDTYFADPSVCALGDTGGRFTTEELLRCERAILDSAASRRGEQPAVVSDVILGRALERSRPALNADQAAAVRAITHSGNGIDTVQALAGTGKTTMLRTLANAYLEAGCEVVGAAPTARAARELRDVVGIPAGTLDALIGRLDRGARLRPGTVLLLDEASMASTRLTARVVGHAEQVGAKIVAVGDPGQLASVQAGGWLAALTRQSPGPQLRQVIRQRDPGERRALEALHDGNADAYLDRKGPDIAIHATEPHAIEAVIDEWADLRIETGAAGTVMIARDNATRELLNRAARDRLKAHGQLQSASLPVGDREWAPGDRVIARRNDRPLNVDNGTIATITELLPNGRGVRIRTDTSEERLLDRGYLLDHLEYAYAITGHSSQGSTVDSAIVVGRPEEFSREWAYTALSRARSKTTIHVIGDHGLAQTERGEYAPAPPDREPADTLDALARAMRRSEVEELAVEHINREDLRAALPAKQPRAPMPSQATSRAPGWASREPRSPQQPAPTIQRSALGR